MKTTKIRIPTRLLSFFLSLLLLFYVIPTTVFAEFSSLGGKKNVSQSTEETGTASASATEGEVYEVTELREESVKHFRLGGGTNVATDYGFPVHYLDANNEWQDIDNTLVDEGNEYGSKDNRIKFAKKITGNESLFTMHNDSGKITLSLNGARKKAEGVVTNSDDSEQDTELGKLMNLENLTSRIHYTEILTGVDLEYLLLAGEIKENILVKKRLNDYTFTFTLKLNGMRAELIETGDILITDEVSGEVCYTIPAPIVYDADGIYAGEGQSYYTLTETGNKEYTFSVTVSDVYMNHPTRVFPITVDPSFSLSNGTVTDTYIMEGISTRRDTSTSLFAANQRITYWKTSTLPTLPEAAYISSATFNLYSSYNQQVYVGIYYVITEWDETLIYSHKQNDLKGLYYLHPVDVVENHAGYNSFDITDTVRGWYAGSPLNLGLALTAEKGTGQAAFSSSESSSINQRPTLIVTYHDTRGVEPYRSYYSHDVGMGATARIDYATGSMLMEMPLLSTVDSILPTTLSLMYDSAMAETAYTSANTNTPYSSYYMPLGFRWNLAQTVVKKELSSGGTDADYYYVYTDADGTEHCFFYDSDIQKYRDEDGLQLYLTYEETDYKKVTIEDASHTKLIFSYLPTEQFVCQFRLYSIEDKYGNLVVFGYDSNSRLNLVGVLPLYEGTVFYIDISYQNNVPYLVIDKEQKIGYYFEYVTAENGKYLSAIYLLRSTTVGDLATWQAYIEGLGGVFSTTDIESQEFHLIQEGKISYGYNTHLAGGNRISTITNTAPDGSTTRFEYQRPANYGTKVWKIVEYGNADTLGQTVTFTYNTGYTVVRNSGTDDRHGNYDDINTYFVFDQYGRVINTYTTDNDDTSGESVNADYIYGAVYGQYETQENAHNSLKIEGTTGGVVTNYLLPDAEDWILSGSCSGNGTTFHFTPAIGEGAGATQYRFLPAGNYTLSFTAIAGGAGMWTYVNITSSAREEDVVDWHFYPHDGEDDALMKRFSISFDIIDYEDGGERVAIAFSTYAESGSQGSTLSVSDIQLEKGIGASEFSLVRMGDFESFTVDSEFSVTRTPSEFWTSSTGTLTLDAYASPFSVCAEVEGIIDGVGYVKQRIFEAPADELNSYDTDSAYAGNNNGLRYIVSGFGLASFAIPSGIFRLRADVIYYQGAGNEPVTISHNFDFLSRCRQWQYVCGSFSTAYSDDAENDYSCIMAIDIYCEYSYQIEAFSALFNKIAVVVDDGSSTVQNEYDADGRLIKKESRFYSEYYEYDANGDLTRIANNRGELTEHTYATEEWNKHRLLHTVTYDFVCADGSTDYPYKEENIDSLITKTPKTKTEYIFNTYGQLNRTTAYPAVYSGTDVVQAPGTDCTIVQNYYVGTLYSRIFGALKSSLDMMTGIYTYYFYDEGRGLLLATVSNDGKSGECYTYDELGNLTSVRPATYVSATEYSALTNAEEVSYTYNDRGLLTKIETQTTAYTFSYDPFGKASSIGMENSTIVSYTYHNYNGKLASITYANGFTEEYTYDALDNLSEIWYTTEDESYLVYQYQYTADGQLYSVFNYQEYKIRYYEYDMSGRLTAVLDDNNGYSYYTYTYDDNSNVATKNHYIDATQTANVSYSYTYDTDNTITGVSIIGIGSISYTYDDFNRLSGRVVKNTDESFKNTVSYIYRRASGQTGMQISAFSSTVGASTSTYSYGYDNARNITKITDGEGREVRYYYDDLSQLVREDNTYLNATYVYTYDNAGNLLSKVTYALTAEGVTPTSPTSTVTYGYSAATGDRLTSYNGAAITYDAIGNPLSYNNGTAYTFTWQGRFMQTATVGGQTYTFTYNEDGLRLDKTSNSNGWYLYYYEGDMLIGECFANHYVLMYVFDADGSPIGHILYPTSSHAPYVYGRFWYEKNLQGDIIAVYDDTGTKLISYTYDAWGNFTTTYHNGASATHGSAQGNLRYRGYYYDKDLGMYWLTTRYYDAKVGRFISPDNLGYLGANGDLNSYNLYAYCSNNPVMYEDPTGNFAISIGTMLLIGTALGILFGAGVDVATQLYENRTSNNDIDLGSVLNSSLVGGALGFSSAAGVVFLGPIIAGASAASASSTLITFGASVGVSALAGAGGYMLQETINGRAAEVKVENVLGHASIVAIEGACNFGVGGMIGSIGNVGQKGKIFTKEWIGKFIFGQEFSFPIKHLLNRLRKGLWE